MLLLLILSLIDQLQLTTGTHYCSLLLHLIHMYFSLDCKDRLVLYTKKKSVSFVGVRLLYSNSLGLHAIIVVILIYFPPTFFFNPMDYCLVCYFHLIIGLLVGWQQVMLSYFKFYVEWSKLVVVELGFVICHYNFWYFGSANNVLTDEPCHACSCYAFQWLSFCPFSKLAYGYY